MKRRKNILNKQIKKRILILCEDEKSSLLYFKSFKQDEEFKRNLAAVSVEVFHPKKYSPYALLKKALEKRKIAEDEKNPYDDIWIVFDKDNHKDIPKTFSSAQKEKVNIAFSAPCFEFWVLLNYEYTTKAFNKCDDLIKYLNTKHKLNYKKCDNCFDILRPKINDAIINATKVEKSVENDLKKGKQIYQLSYYTNVHHLVKILIKK